MREHPRTNRNTEPLVDWQAAELRCLHHQKDQENDQVDGEIDRVLIALLAFWLHTSSLACFKNGLFNFIIWGGLERGRRPLQTSPLGFGGGRVPSGCRPKPPPQTV